MKNGLFHHCDSGDRSKGNGRQSNAHYHRASQLQYHSDLHNGIWIYEIARGTEIGTTEAFLYSADSMNPRRSLTWSVLSSEAWDENVRWLMKTVKV